MSVRRQSPLLRALRDAARPVARGGGLLASTCAAAVALGAGDARAADWLDFAVNSDSVGFAMSGGLALFSAVVAITYIAERDAWTARMRNLSAAIEEARAELDRARTFLHSEPQIFMSWSGPKDQPEIEGTPLASSDSPLGHRVLAFGTWLAPDDAREIELKVARLREKGEAFHIPLTGATGRHFDADGRAVGGTAVLRIREVSGDRLELIKLRELHARRNAEIGTLQGLFEAMPTPVWRRDADGRLVYVNEAYSRAVEAKDPADALLRQIELLDQPNRAAAAAARARGEVWRDRVNAIIAGARHLVDVIEAPTDGASAAMILDRQEIETMRADLQQLTQSHVRTLDQLTTAVAIFDHSRRLSYRNAAFDELWRLDAAFLDTKPTDSEILDRLRAEQRLPVEPDYKAWKAKVLDAHRSPDTQFHSWHVPNGRLLNVVAHPNPQGGVTWLYDDATKAYDLETRVNALYRMQNETLETLHEGVAVFGADGRLKFNNPAFAALWRLDPTELETKPRFETIEATCRQLHANEATWRDLRGFITGLGEAREGFAQRIERSDGVTLDCAAQPLPEGASLLTFVDVTADVNVERALTDRNAALLATEKLRNDFVHHVSYELRSPLNNINGFVHLLGEESTGPLNARQNEYLGYVRKSSAALLAIIDDILDLATIDEDALELELEEVDVRATMRAAIEGVQDRLAESNIELQMVVTDEVGSFQGDPKRVRQILFNLLSNAIGFSQPGQSVTLAAMRRDDDIVFKVTDRGRGIPPEILERVFERFESHTAGSRHRGVGLGLSIVREFVQLHGGKVLVDSAPGEGTVVTCIFPARDAKSQDAPLSQDRPDPDAEERAS